MAERKPMIALDQAVRRRQAPLDSSPFDIARVTAALPDPIGPARAAVPHKQVQGIAADTKVGTGPLLALVGSIALAVLAQTVLLRTRTAMPAAPLFLAACLVGGWVAQRAMPPGPAVLFGGFRPLARGFGWKVALGVAVLCNASCLVLFGRNMQLNLAWLLFSISVVAGGVGFWLLDGRPGLQVNWRDERGWLIALAVLIVAGALLRLIWLGHVPAGLWWDEAADTGLEIRHMLSDPSYRPVFALQPELWRYPALPAFVIFGANAFAIRLPHALAGIAGIVAIYCVGRELYGRKTGLIAAAILVTLVWHLTFSRIAFSAVMSVTLDALALYFLVTAVRTRSWLTAALCGACIGLGVQAYYTSRFMALLLMFFLVMLWIRQPRATFKSAAQLVLGAMLMGAICASPLMEFAVAHPAQFNARVSTLSVLNEVQGSHTIAPLANNLKAHLLMFNLAGDRNGRHNLPGQPELNFLLAGLFVLGLGICLARIRRPEFLLPPVWASVMLAGGVLSVSFEAPQSLRTFDEANVVVLLCALPLALLWDGLKGMRVSRWAGDGWPSRVLAAIPVAVVLGGSGYTDVDRYFQKQQQAPGVFSDSSGAATLLAEQANQLPASASVYMSEQLVGQPTITFLAPRLKHTPFNTSLLPFAAPADTAIFLLGEEAPAVESVRHLYPSAAVEPLTAPYGGPVLLYAIRIDASAIGAAHGVTATYQPAQGGNVGAKAQTLTFTWDSPPAAFPFEASWETVLKAPEYGSYQFVLKAPSSAALLIDGQPVSAIGEPANVQLAQGLHKLTLKTSVASARDTVQLLWQPPGANRLEAVPDEALFGPPVTVSGLLGSYFRNGDWAGQPEFQRIDPQVAFNFHRLPLPAPFSIEWTGEIAAPTAGAYRFGTSAIDSSQLFIDGQQVLDNRVANEYRDTSVTLSAGEHDIRVRYEGHTGNYRVELDWQPPGAGRQPIPTGDLVPSNRLAPA